MNYCIYLFISVFLNRISQRVSSDLSAFLFRDRDVQCQRWAKSDLNVSTGTAVRLIRTLLGVFEAFSIAILVVTAGLTAIGCAKQNDQMDHKAKIAADSQFYELTMPSKELLSEGTAHIASSHLYPDISSQPNSSENLLAYWNAWFERDKLVADRLKINQNYTFILDVSRLNEIPRQVFP